MTVYIMHIVTTPSEERQLFGVGPSAVISTLPTASLELCSPSRGRLEKLSALEKLSGTAVEGIVEDAGTGEDAGEDDGAGEGAGDGAGTAPTGGVAGGIQAGANVKPYPGTSAPKPTCGSSEISQTSSETQLPPNPAPSPSRRICDKETVCLQQ